MTLTPLSDQIMTPAIDLAERIARTEFAPTGLRGRPEAVLAAILTGHELGVGPMVALANIDVIDGRPAIRSHLMRALLARDGHLMWPEESSATRCVMVGTRRDGGTPIRVTWTIDDAKRAGLAGRPNWQKYPRQMLTARATAELARLIAPDTLGGLYAMEEIEDGGLLDLDTEGLAATNGPVEKKTTKRRRRLPATTTPADEPALEGTLPADMIATPPDPEGPAAEPPRPVAPPPAPSEPPLPGEPGYDDEPPPAEPAPEPEPSPEDERPLDDPDRAADDLAHLLGEQAVPPGMVIDELQARVRHLFRLMHLAGYWPANDTDPRKDALHLALRRHTGATHLDTLRKGELIVFTQTAFNAAWDATATPPPPVEIDEEDPERPF